MSSPIQSLARWTSTITCRPTIPLPLSTTLWLAGQRDTEVASAFTPAINNLLDRLVLLSPRTWYGVLQTQTQSAFNAFDAIVMIQSLLATLLPWVALAYGFRHFGSIRQREFLWKTITPAVWLSPWTLSAIYGFVIQCFRLYPPLLFYCKGRMEPLPTAVNTLNERVRQGTVTRHRRYDIYWPCSPGDTCSNSESQTMVPPVDATPSRSTPVVATAATTTAPIALQQAILILPGFGISHVAYSEVASRFADAGILAVVVSMEPLRFAHRHLGADVVSLTRIMKRIQGDQSYEWNLLGHSAGGFAAMHLYQQFQLLQQSNPIIQVRKLILWGCAAIIDMCTDLSPLFQPTDPVSILVLQATQDMLLEMTKDFQPEFQQHFPKSQTRTEWIHGGTHQGFASYESTWAGSPDMATAISYSEQQLEACTKTISFLMPSSTRHTNEPIQDDTG